MVYKETGTLLPVPVLRAAPGSRLPPVCLHSFLFLPDPVPAMCSLYVRSIFCTLILAAMPGIQGLTLARQSPADGLRELMAREARTKEDFTRIIQMAQAHADALHRDIVGIERQNDALGEASRQDYVVRIGSVYRSLTKDEVETLAAAVGLNVLMFDGADVHDMQPIAGVPAGSQLDHALRAGLMAGVDQMTALFSGMVSDADLQIYQAQTASQIIQPALEGVTEQNRAAIERTMHQNERMIESAREAIDALGALVEEALALRDGARSVTASMTAVAGEGYYAVRMSGNGWTKKYAGYATRSEGHEIIWVWADDGATAPVKKYTWEVPTGSDLRPLFQQWKSEKQAESLKACRDLPSSGSVTRPEIWEDGPVYEIVGGPYASNAEAVRAFGTGRKANLTEGSTLQWNTTSGKIADVRALCDALGAPF